MLVNFNEKEKKLFFILDSEIDHHSSAENSVIADDAIKKYLPKEVIFDFENVKFMDSAGIGMLIGRYKQLIRFGGQAKIMNTNKDIERILNMVGMFKVIPKIEKEKIES